MPTNKDLLLCNFDQPQINTKKYIFYELFDPFLIVIVDILNFEGTRAVPKNCITNEHLAKFAIIFYTVECC
jgi:hypothetical protein